LVKKLTSGTVDSDFQTKGLFSLDKNASRSKYEKAKKLSKRSYIESKFPFVADDKYISSRFNPYKKTPTR